MTPREGNEKHESPGKIGIVGKYGFIRVLKNIPTNHVLKLANGAPTKVD